MCTADGTWLGDKDISKALTAWNKLPESDRRPGAVKIEDRGRFDPAKSVQPPPGGLIVKVFMRDLLQNTEGSLCAPRTIRALSSAGARYEILEEPNRDFLWLTEAEGKSLLFERPKKGDRKPLLASIQNRLLRFHLVDGSTALTGPWDRSHLRRAELMLTVEDVTSDTVQLCLRGPVLMADKPDVKKASAYFDGQVLGYVAYNVKKMVFERLDLVSIGYFQGDRNCGNRKRVRVTLGFAMELTKGESSKDRVPPRGTRLVTGSSQSLADYFSDATGTISPFASASR
jgi:hypothetical protein